MKACNVIFVLVAVAITVFGGCKPKPPKANPYLGSVFINATSFYEFEDYKPHKLFLVERKKPSHGFNVAIVAKDSPLGNRAACFIDPACHAKIGEEVKVLTGRIVGVGGLTPFQPIIADNPAPIDPQPTK